MDTAIYIGRGIFIGQGIQIGKFDQESEYIVDEITGFEIITETSDEALITEL